MEFNLLPLDDETWTSDLDWESIILVVNAMKNRKSVKEVVSFAKKCFKQTKPRFLEVRRVKEEKITAFGYPPVVLRSKTTVKYLVCADYTKQLRV